MHPPAPDDPFHYQRVHTGELGGLPVPENGHRACAVGECPDQQEGAVVLELLPPRPMGGELIGALAPTSGPDLYSRTYLILIPKRNALTVTA